MNKHNTFVVTLYTTNGEKTLEMNGEQILVVTDLLQTENEPIPLYTKTEQLYVVGMLIQGRVFTNYQRIIVVTNKEESE